MVWFRQQIPLVNSRPFEIAVPRGMDLPVSDLVNSRPFEIAFPRGMYLPVSDLVNSRPFEMAVFSRNGSSSIRFSEFKTL